MLAQHAQQLLRGEVVGLAGLRDQVDRDDHGSRLGRRQREAEFAQQQVRDDAGEPRARAEYHDVRLAHGVDGRGARRRPGRQQPDTAHPSGRGGDRRLAADMPRSHRVVGVEPVDLGDQVEGHRAHRQHPADGADELTDPAPARRPGRRIAPSARSAAGCRPGARPAHPSHRSGAAARRPSAGARPPPASAASAMRRSPGGSTPSSRRMRPDEPPSSATVTTAVSVVGEPAQRRQRRVQPVPAAQGDRTNRRRATHARGPDSPRWPEPPCWVSRSANSAP